MGRKRVPLLDRIEDRRVRFVVRRRGRIALRLAREIEADRLLEERRRAKRAKKDPRTGFHYHRIGRLRYRLVRGACCGDLPRFGRREPGTGGV